MTRPKNMWMLDHGGTVHINQMGAHWSVDVFAWASGPGDDPIYHAWYDSEDEARADADSWKKWPETDCESGLSVKGGTK